MAPVKRRQRYWVRQRVRYPLIVMETRLPVRRCYSKPGGGICLKEETTWANWSGLCFRWGHWILWIYFRRGTL